MSIINQLHPLERTVLPILAKHTYVTDIEKASKLKDIEVMRALQWLQNKEILKIKENIKEVVTLERNGEDYKKSGLPEKRFLKALPGTMQEINNKLNKGEFNVCLGVLKSKAAIEIKNNNLEITDQGKKLLNQETLEEKFLKKSFPIEIKDLKDEEKFALDNLKKRKLIVKIELKKIKYIELTSKGKKLTKEKIDTTKVIDRLTPDMLKKGSWKNKNFREYDVSINVPKINYGKRHFVNQAIEYMKRIWLDLGFIEMSGNFVQTAFKDLDILFVPQDHPARAMQDTFYIKDPKKGKLPDWHKDIKEIHENGGDTGSTGWGNKWDKNTAEENLLRTHTTVLSAEYLKKISKGEYNMPAKFFSVNKVFRNEALDWKHLFEFNQVEGIVVDPNANLSHLKGYLKEFFGKMGFTDVRMRPAHFPYTEPSVEVDVYNPRKKQWIELGGAGIFRPEVTKPLIGKETPVLAWGLGMERIITEYFDIHDLRELYKNDLKQLRRIKTWMRSE